MDERLNLVRRAVRRKPGAFETLMEQEKSIFTKWLFFIAGKSRWPWIQ